MNALTLQISTRPVCRSGEEKVRQPRYPAGTARQLEG
ncbi:MAG: hypothetical protein DKINENOH_01787 [bacterium]|nr:hypothetical protein [bacterium]